jgi:hypothetical protein
MIFKQEWIACVKAVSIEPECFIRVPVTDDLDYLNIACCGLHRNCVRDRYFL